MALDDTLKERGSRYGTFADNAAISQDLKKVMQASPNWSRLRPSQREALDVISSKISRVLTGDPEYADNWEDIAGYAVLVKKELDHAGE